MQITSKRFTGMRGSVPWLLVLVVTVLAVAAVACGNSESSASSPAAPAPTVAPIAPVSKAPPAVAVVPAEAPAPDSVQAAVLAVLEKQVRSINTHDWAGYVETCSPARKNPTNVAQVKFMFEEFGGEFGYDIPTFSIEGYNARNVVFTIYGDKNVRTTFDIYDYDSLIAEGVSRTWERVDGRWYSDALTCDYRGA